MSQNNTQNECAKDAEKQDDSNDGLEKAKMVKIHSDLPRPTEANASQDEELQYRLAIINRKLLPGYRISLILSTIFYIFLFLLGCKSLKKCPASDYIPLYLVVAGALGMITRLLTFVRSFIKINERILKETEFVLYDFEAVFFILGSYWVYSIYQPSFDPEIEPYCDRMAYLVAFWFITIQYILILILIFASCCLCMCVLCLGVASNEAPSRVVVQRQ